MTTSSRPPIRFILTVAAAALVPGALVAIVLAVSRDRDVETLRREQRGLEYFTAIKAFTRAALEHRRTAGAYVAGTADNVAVARKADAVNAALQTLDEVNGRLGDETTAPWLEALRAEWAQIGKDLPAWARADDRNSYFDHSALLLRHARELAAAAGDANGRAADADPMRRGIFESLVTLVDDADVASQIALRTKHQVSVRQQVLAADARFNRLLERLERNGEQLRHNVRPAAERGPEKYRSKLAAGSIRMEALRTELGQSVEAHLVHEPVDEPAGDAIVIVAERLIDQHFDLFDPLQWALYDSLGEQVARRDRSRVWTGISVALAATLALLAAFAASRRYSKRVPAGTVMERVERLKRLAQELHEATANAVGPSPEKLRDASGRLAKIAASARGIEPATRLLEEMADEASVAALNVELHAAHGGVAVMPEVDRLAERSAASARRVIELARTIETEVATLDKAVTEFGAGDAQRLATLTVELYTAIETLA